ncbi:23790_t:CDS:2, partial [Cetraspora pellucida]
MTQFKRRLLKNHFLISFVSFGANFEDFIEPVIKDIKQLENSLIMHTLYSDAWVIGGIGCITANLPQGNCFASVKQHGVLHGCRTCNVSKIKNQPTKVGKNQLATVYGLIMTPGFLGDIYHSMAAKAHTLLDAMFNALNVAVAKSLKPAFMTPITNNIYQELQQSLRK